MEQRVKIQAWLKWSGRCVCLAMLFIPFMARADSVGKQIVDEALDVSDAETMRLEIRFIMPVSYLWYFPHAQKDDFLIAIRPVTSLGDYNTSVREHVRIPKSLSTVIKDLYYDGTQETDNFIVLETNQNVGISIKQDRDMKSIIVEFTSLAPKPAGECGRQPKKGEAGSVKE